MWLGEGGHLDSLSFPCGAESAEACLLVPFHHLHQLLLLIIVKILHGDLDMLSEYTSCAFCIWILGFVLISKYKTEMILRFS